MSLATEIARHVPFLRRYARALTGSQAEGDGHVRATLEAIVRSPQRFDVTHDPRVTLYRIFQDVWVSRPLPVRAPPARGFIAERIEHIALAPRQALLLTAMEGFTVDDVAEILMRTPPEIEDMVERATRELMALPRTAVLIIEDEPAISLDLSGIVADLGHTVCGTAVTRNEAVAIARSARPGLILADIQLADGSSGIDAVREILALFDVPVIFITAYPERLLTGERPEPTFIVTKPFAPDSVRSTIGHALLLAAESATRAA